MSQREEIQHLETLIRSAFDEGRCGEYYLVDLDITPTQDIAVYIDGDEGVSLGACTQISRVLESILDEEPTLGGIYRLEVSSPGVNRPLKFSRQYPKHIGRTLRIELVAGGQVEGVLIHAGENGISVELKPKDKKSKPEHREISFEEIREAYVTVQFGKKA